MVPMGITVSRAGAGWRTMGDKSWRERIATVFTYADALTDPKDAR